MIALLKKILPYDKALHLIGGLLIGLFGLSLIKDVAIVFILAQLPIFGKEVYDQIKYKGFCWYDILWGEIGLILTMILK